MKLKRAIVVTAILTLLFTGFCTPAPARASTSSAFLYAGIGVGVYLIIVFTATVLVYGEAENGLPPVSIDGLPQASEPSSVHFARGCAQRGGNVTLVCW